MQFRIVLMPSAQGDLHKLDQTIAARVAKKLRFFAIQENPLRFAEHLTDSLYGEYRFRVGDYRIMFDVKRGIIMVLEILRIKHRREAYKK